MGRPSLVRLVALLCPIFSGCRVLPVGRAAEAQGQSPLTGTWQNDLGSVMVLDPPDSAGAFNGTYLTRVAAAHQRPRESPLYGALHLAGPSEQPTFGFTVRWTFSDSTTVFVGQRLVDAAGEERLDTAWLLRERADSPDDAWKATRVGGNTFTRLK
ncbi:avidin-like [Eublepharis macularius]|uniref:Avidin-like n=1 Tax=Eublepharis macularius TaxID=481883 RepID=A0AA97JR13_EUBMA|nr:avidin-like [Eublepharis macularius]